MNIYTITFLVILVFNIIKNKRCLHMLQQNLYNENNRYLKWIMNNLKSVFLNLDLIAMILFIIVFVGRNEIARIVLLIMIILLYILDTFRIISFKRQEKVKKGLVVTKRIKRLIITSGILFMIPLVIFIFNYDNAELLLLISGIMTYLSYIVIYIAKIINTPIERFVYIYYENKAKKKLKSMSNLKVIGITGSYGKTSSKNILNDVLNTKYVCRSTPKNLNTEYGLMITINNYLDKFDEYFIAEMGAYKNGEIRKLCSLVKPKYGILTTIGLQHLESFGNAENIIKTKFELIESLPDDGVAVLNMDDIKQVNYNISSKCKKIWIGINNSDVDVYATDIEYDYKGSKFNVIFKGDSTKYSFETKLLGFHNIYNILASLALGKEFGMSIIDLKKGVSKVKPIENRLELKDFGYMYQINDAYNSNPVGAKMALDVLKLMPGTKVVVTPGMTELGEKEKELNNIFGTQIAKSTDYVILVGEKRTKPIFKGLVESGFDKDKIYVVNNVYDAYKLLRKMKTQNKIYALFENDLPDIYNE